MALFLITRLYDEGIYPSNFVVVDAPSKLVIAEHMLEHPFNWQLYLQNAYSRDWNSSLWEIMQVRSLTPEELLNLIDKTYVDGDSYTQLAIHPITIMPLNTVETDL